MNEMIRNENEGNEKKWGGWSMKEMRRMKYEGNEMNEKDDWNEKEWARRMTKTVLINDEENEGKGKKKVQRKHLLQLGL